MQRQARREETEIGKIKRKGLGRDSHLSLQYYSPWDCATAPAVLTALWYQGEYSMPCRLSVTRVCESVFLACKCANRIPLWTNECCLISICIHTQMLRGVLAHVSTNSSPLTHIHACTQPLTRISPRPESVSKGWEFLILSLIQHTATLRAESNTQMAQILRPDLSVCVCVCVFVCVWLNI